MRAPKVKSKVRSLLIGDPQCYFYGVCCDPKGTIYFTDTKNHKIFKFDSTLNIATLLAGHTKGYEDGHNQKAKFDSPAGICLDNNDGNLLITDQNNCRIRKIKLKDGSVSTVAGSEEGYADGKDLTAKFSSSLTGICVNSKGCIFVADTRNDRIRMIRDGTVSTVCGIGRGYVDGDVSVGKLDRPFGVCCDKSGFVLYIADYERIRKFNDTTKILSTLVSFDKVGGVPSLPVGICLDRSGNLVVTDKSVPTVRVISEKGEVINLAGLVEGNEDGSLASAKFKDPRGVCLGHTGDIVLVDNGNFRLRSLSYDENNLHSLVSLPMKPLTPAQVAPPDVIAELNKEIQNIKKENEVFRRSLEEKEKLMAQKEKEVENISNEVKQLRIQMDQYHQDTNQWKYQLEHLVIQKLGSSGFLERQTLNMIESINFLNTLKIQPTGPLGEQIKKMYSKFPTLAVLHKNIDMWYYGWKFSYGGDLTEDEVKAIYLYTSDLFMFEKKDNFYSILNEILRKRSAEDMQLISGYLSHLLKAISKLSDIKTTIYRGIPNINNEQKNLIEKNYLLNRPIHWASFSSATRNLETTKEIAKVGGIIFVIAANSAKSISSFSMIPKEDEILLHPNMRFKVTEPLHLKEDNFYYITLQEETTPHYY